MKKLIASVVVIFLGSCLAGCGINTALERWAVTGDANNPEVHVMWRIETGLVIAVRNVKVEGGLKGAEDTEEIMAGGMPVPPFRRPDGGPGTTYGRGLALFGPLAADAE